MALATTMADDSIDAASIDHKSIGFIDDQTTVERRRISKFSKKTRMMTMKQSKKRKIKKNGRTIKITTSLTMPVMTLVAMISSLSSISSSSTSSGGGTRNIRSRLPPTTKQQQQPPPPPPPPPPTVMVDKPIGFFQPHPMECNKHIEDDPCLTSWKSKFGTSLVYNETITIPCGSCVVLTAAASSPIHNDHNDSTRLELRGGLIVEGKLVILGEGIATATHWTKLHILTKYIVVYGSLVMETVKDVVDGNPSIVIEWTGGDGDEKSLFRPPYDTGVCGESPTSGCDMGGYGFIVAGGQIDIRGVPSHLTLPTFVPLIGVRDSTSPDSFSPASFVDDTNGETAVDNSSSNHNRKLPANEYLGYNPPPAGCNQDGTLISHDFLVSTESENQRALDLYFRPSFGSMYEMTSRGTMKFVNRTHPQHCPVIDLQRVRPCLQPDQVYLLTARLVLHSADDDAAIDNNTDNTDKKTECSRTGSNCLTVYQAWMNSRGMGHTAILFKETMQFHSKFEEEIVLTFDFSLTPNVLKEDYIFEVLQLRGPGPNIDYELLAFDLRSPPKEVYPRIDDPCRGNLIRNGDAELLDLSPFPHKTNNPEVRLSVIADPTGNHYFSITGRAASKAKAPDRRKVNAWRSAGITIEIPARCIRSGFFNFEADVYFHSSRPSEPRFIIKGVYDDENRVSTVRETIAACPPSSGEWSNCNGSILVSELLDPNFYKYEIVLEFSSEDDGVDYDVDNLKFEFGMSAGFDQLILPKSMQGKWGVGSDIIICSHEFNVPENYIRKIKKIEEYDEGQVLVTLNVPLDQPFTVDTGKNYVGLLSRNILFNATAGGHLSVLSTPGVQQTLGGVELVGFGDNVEPIRFDSCQGGASVVSKNTIRQSQKGCILLDTSSDIEVLDNVAFDFAGPCFVARRGSENNIIDRNIAVPVIRTLEFGLNGKEESDIYVPPVFLTDSKSNTWSGNVVIRNGGGQDQPVVVYEHSPKSSPLSIFSLQESSELDEE